MGVMFLSALSPIIIATHIQLSLTVCVLAVSARLGAPELRNECACVYP